MPDATTDDLNHIGMTSRLGTRYPGIGTRYPGMS